MLISNLWTNKIKNCSKYCFSLKEIRSILANVVLQQKMSIDFRKVSCKCFIKIDFGNKQYSKLLLQLRLSSKFLNIYQFKQSTYHFMSQNLQAFSGEFCSIENDPNLIHGRVPRCKPGQLGILIVLKVESINDNGDESHKHLEALDRLNRNI